MKAGESAAVFRKINGAQPIKHNLCGIAFCISKQIDESIIVRYRGECLFRIIKQYYIPMSPFFFVVFQFSTTQKNRELERFQQILEIFRDEKM